MGVLSELYSKKYSKHTFLKNVYLERLQLDNLKVAILLTMRAAVAVRTIAYLIAILVVGPNVAQLLRSDGESDISVNR